jgi:plasmid stabilization system protein ParE
MRLVLHPKVYSDIEKIMHYYEQVATTELADHAVRILVIRHHRRHPNVGGERR